MGGGILPGRIGYGIDNSRGASVVFGWWLLRSSKIDGMMDLKRWLRDHGLTVKDFALDLEVPLKTAQDWVYRGVAPSSENKLKLANYIISHCAHHWVIATPNGPISGGVCRRCGHHREFQNSTPEYRWTATKVSGAAEKAVQGESTA